MWPRALISLTVAAAIAIPLQADASLVDGSFELQGAASPLVCDLQAGGSGPCANGAWSGASASLGTNGVSTPGSVYMFDGEATPAGQHFAALFLAGRIEQTFQASVSGAARLQWLDSSLIVNPQFRPSNLIEGYSISLLHFIALPFGGFTAQDNLLYVEESMPLNQAFTPHELTLPFDLQAGDFYTLSVRRQAPFFIAPGQASNSGPIVFDDFRLESLGDPNALPEPATLSCVALALAVMGWRRSAATPAQDSGRCLASGGLRAK